MFGVYGLGLDSPLRRCEACHLEDLPAPLALLAKTLREGAGLRLFRDPSVLY